MGLAVWAQDCVTCRATPPDLRFGDLPGTWAGGRCDWRVSGNVLGLAWSQQPELRSLSWDRALGLPGAPAGRLQVKTRLSEALLSPLGWEQVGVSSFPPQDGPGSEGLSSVAQPS